MSDHEQEHGRVPNADRLIRKTLKTVQIFGQICPVSVRSLGFILIQFKMSVFLVHFCLYTVRWPDSVWNYKKTLSLISFSGLSVSLSAGVCRRVKQSVQDS